MLNLDGNLREGLDGSLHLYYDSLESADMKTLSKIMKRESYLTMLEMMSFKHVFKDSSFKTLLENMQTDEVSLKKVEEVVALDLKKRVNDYKIETLDMERKGSDRVVVHYLENEKVKKMYFSHSGRAWKIDSRAGREKR